MKKGDFDVFRMMKSTDKRKPRLYASNEASAMTSNACARFSWDYVVT